MTEMLNGKNVKGAGMVRTALDFTITDKCKEIRDTAGRQDHRNSL